MNGIRRNAMWSLTQGVVAALLVAPPPSHGQLTRLDPQPLTLESIGSVFPEVESLLTVNGRPAVRLKDGSFRYMLDPVETFTLRKIAPFTFYAPPAAIQQCATSKTFPKSVNLAQYSAFPKRQGDRGTCVSFALVAAMEARYRRLGISVDLSEQYVNHLQKMTHLREVLPTSENYRENQLGAWDGSSIHYVISLLHRYRVPEEKFLPYIDKLSYVNTNEPTDNPRMDFNDVTLPQRWVNDFNLAPVSLPQAALENAKYGISSYRHLAPEEHTADMFKCILAAGYEIVTGLPGHAYLLVGYDDDLTATYSGVVDGRYPVILDKPPVFLVKNSWGEQGPVRRNQDLILWRARDGGYESGYVIDVQRNPDANYRLEHLFLGRWQMDHDGWKGILDINRAPGFFNGTGHLGSQTDNRIGTYFNPDGKPFRVNGTISGNKLEFYIDWKTPNLNYGEMHGSKFTAYLFSWDRANLAGSMLDANGQTYGFYATKADRLAGAAAPGNSVTPNSYLGTWSMNHDGWRGRLTIPFVAADGRFTGTYLAQDGRTLSVTGQISTANNRVIDFSIPFSSTSPQPFHGYMYSWERGVLSGTTMGSGVTYGFYASRN